jgi:hypothetical protein
MAGWEPATKEQKEYLQALREKAATTRQLKETGGLNRNEISKEINKLRVELGEIPPMDEEEEADVIDFTKHVRYSRHSQQDDDELFNKKQMRIFRNLLRVEETNAYSARVQYVREPPNFCEPEEALPIVFQKYAHTMNWGKYRTGWVWTCRNSIHRFPVWGGSYDGWSATILGAERHAIRYHKDLIKGRAVYP